MRIKDCSTYKVNPTKPEGIKREIRYPKAKGNAWTNIETGEIAEMRLIAAPKEVVTDSLPYVKFYKAYLDLVPELSLAAQKVLFYAMKNLKPKQDEIRLYVEDVMSSAGFTSKSVYYKGLTELLQKEILFRIVGNDTSFFINVNVFFNGDRSHLFEEEISNPNSDFDNE